MKKIRIVGAGFSGLSLAYFLVQKGFTVEVYEKSPSSGGLISSPETRFGVYETAANAFMSTALVEDFVQDLGLEPLRPGKTAKNRYIYRGFPKRWPLSFVETVEALGRFLKQVVYRRIAAQDNETILGWGTRVLGQGATHFLLMPVLQGIYGGDSEILSAELIFKKSRNSRKPRARGLLSFEGGMGQMIQTLEKKLKDAGVNFYFSTEIQASSSPTVICTNPQQAAALLSRFAAADSTLGSLLRPNIELLQKIKMRSLATVTAFFAKAPLRFAGFGILFPKEEGRWPLGILQNSHIFQRSASYFSETWILSGNDLSDDKIREKLIQERQVIFREAAEPLELVVTRWPQALPHYTLDLKNIIGQLEPMPSIWLHGNYLGGIGLSKILERSRDLAEEINLVFSSDLASHLISMRNDVFSRSENHV